MRDVVAKRAFFSPNKNVLWIYIMSSILFGKGSLFSTCVSANNYKNTSSSLDHSDSDGFKTLDFKKTKYKTSKSSSPGPSAKLYQ